MKSTTSFLRRGLLAFASAATVLAVGTATTASLLASEPQTTGASSGRAGEVFYTTSDNGLMPNGAEIWAITVSGGTVTTRDIGPTHGGDCITLALSPHGKLYSMCGSLFGDQRLATIDQDSGQAAVYGRQVTGLAVMALSFAPNGKLYAVGGCSPDPSFECQISKDPKNLNVLYTVNVKTGRFKRVGPTGAPEFFMDLAVTPDGDMLGVTTTVNPSSVPAKLYRVNLETGRATKLLDLVGSNSVMGLAFGRDRQLYATDFTMTQNAKLYRIDTGTGVETSLAGLPFAFSSSLELLTPDNDLR